MSSLTARIDAADNITSAAMIPWMARAAALNAHSRIGRAAAAAEAGAPAQIVEAIKSAVAATDRTSDLAGTSTAVTAFLEAAAGGSVLLRMIADRATHRAPLNARLMSATGVSASVVAEGAPIRLSAATFKGEQLHLHKVAAMLAITDDLWRDTSSAGQQFVIKQLREAVGQAADAALFADIITASDLGTAADVPAALAALLAEVHTTATASLYWALSPTAANAAAVLDHPRVDPLGGTILGRPAVITSGLSGKQIALIDARGLVAEVEGVSVTASGEALLEMDDAPTHDATTPTGASLVSMFQTDTTAVRALMYLGAHQLRTGAAAVIEVA